jgi:hypothetical protein
MTHLEHEEDQIYLEMVDVDELEKSFLLITPGTQFYVPEYRIKWLLIS